MMERAAALWHDPGVTAVTPDLIGLLMRRDPKASASTQASHRRILNGFFSFAGDRGIRQNNPVARVKVLRAAAHSDDIQIVSPAQCRDLLVAMKEHAPILVPANAIGLFDGLRVGELHRPAWEHVRLSRGLIFGAPKVLFQGSA